MAKKKWSDLTTAQQAVILVAGSVQLALAATAWADLATRDASEIDGSKAKWAAIIAVNFVGPLTYFAKGRKESGRPSSPGCGMVVVAPWTILSRRRARDAMDRDYASPLGRGGPRARRADVARPLLAELPRCLRGDPVQLSHDAPDRAGQGAATPR